MATMTIKRSGYISIPRKEYEEFSDWKIITGGIKTFKPTKADLRVFEQAQKDMQSGNYILWSDLKNELDNIRTKKRRKTN